MGGFSCSRSEQFQHTSAAVEIGSIGRSGVGGGLLYDDSMSAHVPAPIPPAEIRRRRARALRLARSLGFVGRVEYRHVFAPTGGAQYGRGVEADGDLLWLSAGDDFSLRAIIAHECGHQVLARHPRFAGRMAGMPAAAEEMLASLIGAWLVGAGADCDMLVDKAAADLTRRRGHGGIGRAADRAVVGASGRTAMTGRKTLREVREQLAVARAGGLPTADASAQEALEALEHLADELDPAKDGRGEGKPSSQDAASRTKRGT